ncbi:hypothetical protein CEXT_424621, partial [Caerostris extrusa]
SPERRLEANHTVCVRVVPSIKAILTRLNASIKTALPYKKKRQKGMKRDR